MGVSDAAAGFSCIPLSERETVLIIYQYRFGSPEDEMNEDLELARIFLNFMVDYYALLRRHLIETNQFRFNSHGFSMLYTLQKYKNQPITMTPPLSL